MQGLVSSMDVVTVPRGFGGPSGKESYAAVLNGAGSRVDWPGTMSLLILIHYGNCELNSCFYLKFVPVLPDSTSRVQVKQEGRRLSRLHCSCTASAPRKLTGNNGCLVC